MQIKALLYLKSELNVIYPNLALKLGFWDRNTNISIQKIDKSYLNITNMQIARFSAKNKHVKIRFFEKTFMLTLIILNVIMKRIFLILVKV